MPRHVRLGILRCAAYPCFVTRQPFAEKPPAGLSSRHCPLCRVRWMGCCNRGFNSQLVSAQLDWPPGKQRQHRPVVGAEPAIVLAFKKNRALMLLVNGNVEPVAAFLKHQSETGRDEQGLAVHWFVTTPMAQLLEMLATVDDKTDQDYRSVHQWLEEHALSEWITKLNTQEGVLPSTQTLRLQLLGSRGECVATPMPHNHHALRKWAQRFRMKHKLRIAKLDVHGGGRIEETRDKAPVIEPEKWFPRVEIVVQFCGPANSSPIWTSCSC